MMLWDIAHYFLGRRNFACSYLRFEFTSSGVVVIALCKVPFYENPDEGLCCTYKSPKMMLGSRKSTRIQPGPRHGASFPA